MDDEGEERDSYEIAPEYPYHPASWHGRLPGPGLLSGDELVKKHEDVLARYMVPANDMTAQNRLAAMQAEAFTVSKSDNLDVEHVQKALDQSIDLIIRTAQEIKRCYEKSKLSM